MTTGSGAAEQEREENLRREVTLQQVYTMRLLVEQMFEKQCGGEWVLNDLLKCLGRFNRKELEDV